MWIEKLLYIGIAVGLVFFQFGNIKVLLLHCVIRIPMKYLISAAKSLGVEEKVSYYVIDRYVMDMS